MSEEELTAFEQYFYHITADRGSGEFALRHLLGPFAWARNALESRLHELKVCGPSGQTPPLDVHFSCWPV